MCIIDLQARHIKDMNLCIYGLLISLQGAPYVITQNLFLLNFFLLNQKKCFLFHTLPLASNNHFPFSHQMTGATFISLSGALEPNTSSFKNHPHRICCQVEKPILVSMLQEMFSLQLCWHGGEGLDLNMEIPLRQLLLDTVYIRIKANTSSNQIHNIQIAAHDILYM